MRLLITGGAGFIGSNLARAAVLRRTVSDIRILDDLATGQMSDLFDGLDVDTTPGSMLDDEALDRAG